MAQAPPAPTLDEFLDKARPLNPTYTDAQIRAEWLKAYGPAAQPTPSPSPTTSNETPSLAQFLDKARPLNPDLTDYQLKQHWQRLYGTRQGHPATPPTFGERVQHEVVEPFAEAAKSVLYRGPTQFFDWLDDQAARLAKSTGLSHGGLFKQIADLARTKAQGQPVNPTLATRVMSEVGRATTADLPKLWAFTNALGPVLGFGALGAYEESGRNDATAKSTIVEALKGGLLGAAYKALEPLGLGGRTTASGALFAGQSAAEGERRPEALAEHALTGAVFAAPGPVSGMSLREAAGVPARTVPTVPRGTSAAVATARIMGARDLGEAILQADRAVDEAVSPEAEAVKAGATAQVQQAGVQAERARLQQMAGEIRWARLQAEARARVQAGVPTQADLVAMGRAPARRPGSPTAILEGRAPQQGPPRPVEVVRPPRPLAARAEAVPAEEVRDEAARQAIAQERARLAGLRRPEAPGEAGATVTPAPPGPLPTAREAAARRMAELQTPEVKHEETASTVQNIEGITDTVQSYIDRQPEAMRPYFEAKARGFVPDALADFGGQPVPVRVLGWTNRTTAIVETPSREAQHLVDAPQRMVPLPGQPEATVPRYEPMKATETGPADPMVTQPRDQLPPAESEHLETRAVLARDLLSQGEPGRRVFVEHESGAPEVRGVGSTYPDFYGPLAVSATKKLSKKQRVLEALDKIVRDQGEDVGPLVEKVKRAILEDRSLDDIAGERPSPQEGEAAQDLRQAQTSERGVQTEMPLGKPEIAQRPLIGREPTPEEAPLFSKAAQIPEPEQLRLEDRGAAYGGLTDSQRLYENSPSLPLRPDADAAQSRQLTLSALGDLDRAAGDVSAAGGVLPGPERVLGEGSGVRTRALGFTPELIRTGRLDLRGQIVRNAADLAELAQVVRDPRFETFRLIYTKGDRIVGHEAVTSRLPGTSSAFVGNRQSLRALMEMKDRMRRLDADGYYMLHNHPSGNPDPSMPDLAVTDLYRRYVPGYRGHVIVDSGTWGWIDAEGTRQPVQPLRGAVGPDAILTATLPHSGLGLQITSADKVAQIGTSLKTPEGWVTLLYHANAGGVRAIQEMPLTLFQRTKGAADFIRGRVREFGGSQVFAYYPGRDAAPLASARDLIRSGHLTDYVYASGLGIRRDVLPPQKTGTSLMEQTPYFGKNLDEIRGMRVHETEEGPLATDEERSPDETSRTGALHQLVQWYKTSFQPELISSRALMADPLFAKMRATKAQQRDAIIREGHDAYDYWTKVPVQERLQFLDQVESGAEVTGSPVREALAVRYRAALDRTYRQEVALGSKGAYVQDYLPHLWKDPQQAKIVFEDYGRANNLGPKWFQKARYIDLIRKGLDAGLELKTTNPEELVEMRLLAGADFQANMRLLQDMQREGLAIKTREAQGYQQWADGWMRVNAPNREQYLIASDVIPLWKNAVEAKSLWASDGLGGSIFRGWMAFKNVWVPIKLAFSLFHPLHVLHINWSNYGAAAFSAFSRGDLEGAVSNLGRVARLFPSAGRAGREAWATPAEQQTPEQQAVTALLTEGGFSAQLSEELRIAARRNLRQALAESRYFSALPHGIRRGIEMMQAPIFERWIPDLKVAAYLNAATDLARQRPDLMSDPTQRRLALRAIGKSIDNRFGEMFYSTLFWNRTLKDAGIGSFLSLGWNLGFLREFGGAAQEAITRPAARLGLFEPGAERQVIQSATNKIAFVTTYVTSALILNAIMSYALSGQTPEGWDLIFPRVGGEDPNGNPRRITNMYYTREVAMAKKHVEDAGGNVLSGLGAMIWNKTLFEPFKEVLENRNYYGYDIWDVNAPWYRQTEQFVTQALKEQISPITISGASRALMTGGTWTKDVPLALLGFGPAPAYVGRSAMENRIQALYRRHVAPAARPEEAGLRAEAQMEIRNDILAARRRGDAEQLRDAIQRGHAAGMTSRQILELGRQPSAVRMFKQLPNEDQRALLEDASADERQTYLRHAHMAVRREFFKKRRSEAPPSAG